ncbi:hypothetical protein [Paracoccus yeei]|uniref:Uncharacterized protein n=1 Tax=Paracoccus yeei TaxID=147645 RepID=A0A5P2QLB3_9RHOB|nr:hypothetical protein [Paracoccus yeei]QEU06595.1 hypothetical protein FOB51_00550 [Paracoccus yeei]
MSQPNLRVAIYPFEPRLEIRAQMLLAIEEIGHAGDINDQPGGGRPSRHATNCGGPTGALVQAPTPRTPDRPGAWKALGESGRSALPVHVKERKSS